jgi:signal transduction histidine kinase
MSHALGQGITGRVALTGQPIAVEDALADPRVAHHITNPEGIRSLLHVPIKVNGEVFGVFGVNYRNKRSLAGDEERVLLALAHRASVAIEHAQVYAESEQRLEEIEALYRADEALHRSLRVEDVLNALVEVATEVLHADKASVHLWDAQRGELVIAASLGYSTDQVGETLFTDRDPFLLQAVQAGQLLVLDDAASDPRLSDQLRDIIQREHIRSVIGAPIRVSGQTFGLFGVGFCHHRVPSRRDQRVAQAIAQRAALAIQNARLFEQAQQAATTEERERLARELHDAVTQTLFSASLIAEVVPRLWDRNPDEGRRRVEELRRLTRGALAEMRTLLLELRPAALVETPFNQLLNQLAETTASRSNLEVSVRADGEVWTLPAEVHIALYRIAQESLNNVTKHASANHATVHVRWRRSGIDVRIKDDGRGFILQEIPGGRLGLGIMQERARTIAAQLRVHSHAARGTTVNLHWRAAK